MRRYKPGCCLRKAAVWSQLKRQSVIGPLQTTQGKIREDKTRRDKTQQNKTGQEKTRQDRARQERQAETRRDKTS